MRLFIGIKTHCEDHLQSLQTAIKSAGKGSFTRPENLHITLKFLGEVPSTKLDDIKSAVSRADAVPFRLQILGVHLFNRSGIVAAKVGGDLKSLTALHARLESALEKHGFSKEQRVFRPHITLARKFRPNSGADIETIPYKPCGFNVEEIILFESKRVEGRLVYDKVFVKRLR